MPMYNLTNINKIMVGSQEYSKVYLGSEVIKEGYTILTPEMVEGTLGAFGQRYIGTATKLIIDGSFLTNNLNHLFRDNQIIKSVVILTNYFTNMRYMFYNSQSTSLDLLSFNTSRVTDMQHMFRFSQATSLDLSSFDTSNVTNMSYMFADSPATSLDLSSFDTSKVTNMSFMFYNSQATILDLSSFDTSKATYNYSMPSMFRNAQATIGYARTQADADRFNASANKPETLNFIVKP